MPVQIAFAEVQYVEQNLSRGAKIAIIIAAVAAAVIVVLMAAYESGALGGAGGT